MPPSTVPTKLSSVAKQMTRRSDAQDLAVSSERGRPSRSPRAPQHRRRRQDVERTCPGRPGDEGGGVAEVTVVTCVASQKLVSSTACIISSVSPLSGQVVGDEQWSTKPSTPPTAVADAVAGRSISRIRQSTSAPQPMKMADEYRLVTNTSGGPSGTCGRAWRPVWTTSVNTASQKAARRSGSLPAQPGAARQQEDEDVEDRAVDERLE